MNEKPPSSEPERSNATHDEQAQRQKIEKKIEQADPAPARKKGAPPEGSAPLDG